MSERPTTKPKRPTTKPKASETKPFVKPTPKNAMEALVRSIGKAIRGGIHGMIPSESEDSDSVAAKLGALNYELGRSRAAWNVRNGTKEHGGISPQAKVICRAISKTLRGYADGLDAIAVEDASTEPTNARTTANPFEDFFAQQEAA